MVEIGSVLGVFGVYFGCLLGSFGGLFRLRHFTKKVTFFKKKVGFFGCGLENDLSRK